MSEDPPAGAVQWWRVGASSIRPGGRANRLGRFGIVGVTGIAVNEAALALLVSGLHLRYIVGYLLATQFSTVWNFAWIETWAFKSTSRPTNSRMVRFASLLLVNNAANLLTVPFFLFLTVVAGVNYLVSNMLVLGIVFLIRFVLAERIWDIHPTRTAQT